MMRRMGDEHKILSRCHGIVLLSADILCTSVILKSKHLFPFLVLLLQLKYICSSTLSNFERRVRKKESVSCCQIASLVLVNKNMYPSDVKSL